MLLPLSNCQAGCSILLRSHVRHAKLFNNYLRSLSRRAYLHNPGTEPLLYRSLGEQFQKSVEKYAQRPALISCFEQKTLTFEEAQHEADKLLLQLKSMCLKTGDHVGIWAPNGTQWYVSFLAAIMGGYAVACLNPALQSAELLYALQKGRVKALITMDKSGKQNFVEVLDKALKIKDKTADFILKHIIVQSNQALPNNYYRYEDLLAIKPEESVVQNLHNEIANISPEASCCIQYTSGTTGQPKAALLSYHNFVNQSRIFGRNSRFIEGRSKVCLPLPMFHVFGISVLSSALYYGAALVLPSANFNAGEVVKAMEKEQCDIIMGTPTMYVDVVAQQVQLQRDLTSLQLAVVGGASCTQELYKRTKQILDLKNMFIVYGLSETTAAIFSHDGTENDEFLQQQTVGKMFEHLEAKVINAKGETVMFGEPGDLCIRGVYKMIGYYGDEAKTKETITEEGWLKTGDEFILESNGYGRVVGRKKDLIIRGGENIYPKEIEDHLDAHEHILESQVIGVPDERMGEEVCAFLRLQPNAPSLTAADIKTFCTGILSHYKIPRYVKVVEEFPKTTSGKIQKFRLLDLFKKLEGL